MSTASESALTPAIRQRFVELFLEFLADRDRELGADGGLHNHYAVEARRGNPINMYEDRTVESFLNDLPRYDGYVEIGAGFGQLGVLLSVFGLRTVSIESWRQRYEGFFKLREYIAREWPDVASLATAQFGEFPMRIDGIDPARSLIFANNIVSGASAEKEGEMIEAISTFKAAMIDSSRFTRRRSTLADCEALENRFAEAGMKQKRELWSFFGPNSHQRFVFLEHEM